MLGRTVAIKVVHPHLLSEEQSVARFYTEARAASRLNHPNSVSIIDFGRTDDGILFLVMEFLRGRDLAWLLREEGALSVARTCEVTRAVLDALAEAHALAVVHRDLKPENVIIERMRNGGDLVKVVDFGLAKLLQGAQYSAGITLPGLVCGTPDYMSPEQGRGLEVDGRGDLYSVGVMLFELLTGQLPFAADTPTNVVLRHIQDPVPDPRDVARGRRIPAGLAAVVMRAMAKEPQERYANAVEMGRALRPFTEQSAAAWLQVPCSRCGYANALSSRYCANCGEERDGVATRRRRGPRSQGEKNASLVGRDAELMQIQQVGGAADTLAVIALVGEVGSGRTRLLAAVAESAASAHQLVVWAGPHPSGAPVPYHPIRMLVQGLLAVDLESASLNEAVEGAALFAAGLDELREPVGLRGAEGESRAFAVAAFVEHVVHTALQAHDARRALLIVDDLNRCDGLSQEVVRVLCETLPQLPACLLVVGQGERELHLPRPAAVIESRPLTFSEARAQLEGAPYASEREPDPDETLVLPLYVEQLRALNLDLDLPKAALPQRLADAIGQRVSRLPRPARLLLQAAAVLGMQCTREDVLRVCPNQDVEDELALALRSGLLRERAGLLELSHPFVRDLIEASTPAAARRELHGRALRLTSELGAPLEVRGRHAYGFGEALGALVLLERMGDLALSRGDVDSAILGYRRALELARQELFETGELYLEGAIESISRRLGLALARRGDLVQAEGVLREALEFAAPTSSHRAQILIGLSQVLASKQHVREGRRLLAQALEIAIVGESEATQVDALMALSQLLRAEGEHVEAVTCLARAQRLLTDAEPDRLKQAQVALGIAQLQVDQRQFEAARRGLPAVVQISHAANSPYLAARALGLQARVHQALGDDGRAQDCLANAAEMAEQAGDGRLAQRFRSLARAGTDMSPLSGAPGTA